MNEVQAVVATAAVAAVIAIWGILSQRGISARQSTIEFIARSEADRDLIEARKEFNRLAREPEGLGKWAHQPNSEEFKNIRLVLNEYELVAIGVQRGILDDTTYRRWHRSGVIKSWNHAAPFILARRNKTGSEMLWHEFEEMARFYRGSPKMPRRRFFWGKFF